MDTKAFPEQTETSCRDKTEEIRLVSFTPETNLERAMYWLDTLSGETFSITERINLANVYAALALQDAVRDVTVSLVKLGRSRK